MSDKAIDELIQRALESKMVWLVHLSWKKMALAGGDGRGFNLLELASRDG